jgi:vacuolar-type H+-ATPase subunit E/Vma4
MALDQLLASLTRDAEASIADLLHAARTDADAALAEAADARRRRLEEAVAARRRALEGALEEDVVEAGREASRAVLRVRETILGRVLEEARAAVATRTPDPAVARASAALVESAVTYLAGQGGALRCHPSLRCALEPICRAHGLALHEDPSLDAGAQLASADGRLVVDATLDQLLLRHWPAEAIRLAAHLEAVR